jgi:hypothetical protein
MIKFKYISKYCENCEFESVPNCIEKNKIILIPISLLSHYCTCFTIEYNTFNTNIKQINKITSFLKFDNIENVEEYINISFLDFP